MNKKHLIKLVAALASVVLSVKALDVSSGIQTSNFWISVLSLSSRPYTGLSVSLCWFKEFWLLLGQNMRCV